MPKPKNIRLSIKKTRFQTICPFWEATEENISAIQEKICSYLPVRKMENTNVYFVDDNKTVTLESNSMDIALGNASPASIAALKAASQKLGWRDPLASFWTQRDGHSVLTVGGLSSTKICRCMHWQSLRVKTAIRQKVPSP